MLTARTTAFVPEAPAGALTARRAPGRTARDFGAATSSVETTSVLSVSALGSCDSGVSAVAGVVAGLDAFRDFLRGFRFLGVVTTS